MDLAAPDQASPPPADMAHPADLTRSLDGLAAWYHFDEDSGPVIDSSGHGYNGVAEGSTYHRGVAGHLGKAIQFQGGDGRVRVPRADGLDFKTGATVELWVNLETQLSGSLTSRGNGGGDNNFLLYTGGGAVLVEFELIGTHTAATNSTADNTVALNTWTHVAAVNDGTYLNVYVNGNSMVQTTGGAMAPLLTDLYIGRQENQEKALIGSIDELMWWTVARPQSAICDDAEGKWDGSTCQH